MNPLFYCGVMTCDHSQWDAFAIIIIAVFIALGLFIAIDKLTGFLDSLIGIMMTDNEETPKLVYFIQPDYNNHSYLIGDEIRKVQQMLGRDIIIIGSDIDHSQIMQRMVLSVMALTAPRIVDDYVLPEIKTKEPPYYQKFNGSKLNKRKKR